MQQLPEKDNFQGTLLKTWLQEQSEIPFQVYAWPSESMDGPTHPKTKTFNLAFFYNDNINPTLMRTQNKKQQSAIPICVIAEVAKKKEHRITTCHWTTYHSGNILHHAILQVSKSHPGQEETN